MAKNPLSEARRAELKAETRDLAASVVEDLEHIREVIARRDPIRGELRRLSAVLRRLITDDEINRAAACRTGRVKVLQPDTRPIIKASEKNPLEFYCTGGASVFGMTIASAMAHAGPALFVGDYHPERTVEVDVGSFVKQPVLCVRGEWATRGAVITYVANVASGVHSKRPLTEADRIIGYARGMATFKIENEAPTVVMHPSKAFVAEHTPLPYEPASIDPVLVELLATATFVAGSPGVINLEQSIRDELDLR